MGRYVAVFLGALLLGGCTWVKVTPDGEKVRVLGAGEVAKCERMGQTTVQVLSKLAGMERHPEKVQEELNGLARNSAVDLKGDTVVPMTPVSEGRQTFGVYRCMPQ